MLLDFYCRCNYSAIIHLFCAFVFILIFEPLSQLTIFYVPVFGCCSAVVLK